ncbi:MAG: alkaline phosphatase family protein, partial [Bacteroidales bacterium]|nr:alkaline phosphatase family protein [Bacteroidales bacterium]
MKKTLFLYLIVSLFITSCTQEQAKETEKPYLIIVSMDGFRWDYPDSVPTPSFDAIAKMGIKAESMQAAFPSKTFPNHYTLVTGLYPNHHGIVNNSFYAPEYDETYTIRDKEAVGNGKFYDGEPIWNTAEKQGIKAATFFWVGSEANIQDMRPSIWKKYDHHLDFYQRVDSVISWLS